MAKNIDLKLPNYLWDIQLTYRWCIAFACSRMFHGVHAEVGPITGDGQFHILTHQEKVDFVTMYCAGGEL